MHGMTSGTTKWWPTSDSWKGSSDNIDFFCVILFRNLVCPSDYIFSASLSPNSAAFLKSLVHHADASDISSLSLTPATILVKTLQFFLNDNVDIDEKYCYPAQKQHCLTKLATVWLLAQVMWYQWRELHNVYSWIVSAIVSVKCLTFCWVWCSKW